MQAFDKLPKAIRNLLNDAPVRMSASDIYEQYYDEDLEEKGIDRTEHVKRAIRQNINFIRGMEELQKRRIARNAQTKDQRRRSTAIY